uniref:Uncharacterized protein n=1 Tax=Mustela putorius furo TaxID=9669 RepID=M3YKI2_MUSPF
GLEPLLWTLHFLPPPPHLPPSCLPRLLLRPSFTPPSLLPFPFPFLFPYFLHFFFQSPFSPPSLPPPLSSSPFLLLLLLPPRSQPPPPSRVLEPGPDAAGRRSQGALTHRLTQREVSCQQTPAGGGGAPGVLATVSEALLGTGAHGLPRERPFRLPTSAERDGRPPGGRGALRDARGGQRETQMCRTSNSSLGSLARFEETEK